MSNGPDQQSNYAQERAGRARQPSVLEQLLASSIDRASTPATGPFTFNRDCGWITETHGRVILFVASGHLNRLANGEFVARAMTFHDVLVQMVRELATQPGVDGELEKAAFDLLKMVHG